MFVEGKTVKFHPYRKQWTSNTIDIPVIKNVSYVKRSSRFPVKSLVTDKSVSHKSIYTLLDKQDR